MTFKQHCMGSGIAAQAAGAVVGGATTGIVAAGTTAAGATLLPFSSICSVDTAANNSGVILPPGNGSGDGMQPGDWMDIYNGDSNTLLLYPPAGGTLNSGTVTTGTVSISNPHQCYEAKAITNLKFIVQGPTT